LSAMFITTTRYNLSYICMSTCEKVNTGSL